MKLIVIWGSQLTIDYHSALKQEPDAAVLMIESRGLSSRYRFHKQKLMLVLTAMREYADELKDHGRTVYYITIDKAKPDWFETLGDFCHTHNVTEIIAMRASDRPPQTALETWCKEHRINLKVTPNLQFLTPTAQFNEWADQQTSLRMENFYRWQRKRLHILIDDNGKPAGGKWNYDAENREPLPKDTALPPLPKPAPSKHRADIKAVIDTYFSDHPGSYEIDWLPTTRAGARAWLKSFITERFSKFGKYEDAMRVGEPFMYHSALSALLNIGLLHAEEVVTAALKADVPLAAKEGFVRQVIGWREFMFGLYQFKPLTWKEDNFLHHTKKLEKWWWGLNTEAVSDLEPPLADTLKRLHMYGYSHHIERLMVLGNYMLLKGYAPQECYDWFMSMYVDAHEWVMVPNVIGMSQYADGGMDNGGFATKPYISGSNYLQKMGSWWPTAKAAKQSQWTQLYWDFLERHADTLRTNYRLRPLIATLERRKHDH